MNEGLSLWQPLRKINVCSYVSYEKLFKLKYDNNGYLESYKRNEDEIQKEIDKLGFFVIVTSKEMTASEALDIYRKRDSVEKIFRMLKTGLEYDTFRVHSQDSLESKTYVMFIASIVRNYLFQGLKKVSKILTSCKINSRHVQTTHYSSSKSSSSQSGYC